MAPPGTWAVLPQAVPRPRIVDLTSDDPPVDQDSEEEDFRGSNIPMSKVEQSRIKETPQKPSSFAFDLSSYAHVEQPRKRPIDSYANSFPPNKKPKAIIRQTGPSRAVAIDLTEDEPELRLEEIPEVDMRRKVERLGLIYSTHSVQQLYTALLRKKGNYEDTVGYLADQSEDELSQGVPKGMAVKRSPEPVMLPKSTMKRSVNAKAISMQDRYAKPSHKPSQTGPVSPVKSTKKRKLMRGRRNRSPSPKPTEPDEEDEGIIISSDSDSEVVAEAEDVFDESSLLDFFNKCTVEAMVDLSGHKEEEIRSILEHRPFRSLTVVEKLHVDLRKLDNGKKARKPKITFGQRLADAARDMWNAYETIDKVVQACETRGKPIVNGMTAWGVNVFGASTDGEVTITNLEGNDRSRDSGYQSPRSSNGSESEREPMSKAVNRNVPGKRGKLLTKPAIMNDDIELKDYQVVGLNWLNLLWRNGISGILADDMGLGKTCQVIAFLSHLKETGAQAPHVVIVPGSTLENWAREFEHFSREINFDIYYGSQGERAELQDMILDKIQAGETDVILTTYDLAFKKQDNVFLRKCRPQMCIFDEGHVLRNSNTQRYQSLMRINAKCRLLLTGTPLQNSLAELASILAFLMPDIFDKEEVRDSVAVVFKHKAKVNESDTHGTLLSTQRINRARSMLTPFVLRRKKAQVLKYLPKKTCRVEYCELTPLQKKLYDEGLQQQRQVLLDRAAGLQPKENANIMMRLRKAALHPLLFRERFTDDILHKMSKACLREPQFSESDPDRIFEELQLDYSDMSCHQMALKYPRHLGKFALKNHEWMDAGKITALVALLKKYKENGDRTLVFSQFTTLMDILEWVLDDLGIGYCRLDGQTAISERQQLLDEFYNDETIGVFMLSTKSGGAGINLACANKVIIFDSSFNPQDDIQAENRAHRVGQTREVEVVRLVTKGTVEEQIYKLGVSKLELDKLVAGEEGNGSRAEKAGEEAVERMLLEQLRDEKMEGGGDIKELFLKGLKEKGLDMSAA